jgi:hypothetical protein
MPTSTQYAPNCCYDLTATIAVSGTTSGAVDLSGCTLVGLFIPATFDGTTLTITASSTPGGTYVSVQQDHTSASAYTITTAASRFVPLDNLYIPLGLEFIKLVAGSTQTTTDTVITLAVRAV